MTQWSERGVRPTEPGRYDVECIDGRRVYEVREDASGLVIRNVYGGTWVPLNTSRFTEFRWFRIPDPPVEVPKNKWFSCKHRDVKATGYRDGDHARIRIMNDPSGFTVPLRDLTDIRVLPEEFQ